MDNSIANTNGHGAAAFAQPATTTLERGDLKIDLTRHTITLAGKKLDLSATEFELLAHLTRLAPQVVTPQELAARVQGYEGQSLQEANATLRYHFYRLRRKIKQSSGRDDLIKTIHGVGYSLAPRPDSDLPAGSLTFLFTDIQDSTVLWEQFPQEMKAALARHDTLVQQYIEASNGYIFKRAGDMFCAVFTFAPDALTAAVLCQRILYAERWVTPLPLRVRIALHTGVAELRDGDYFGAPLNLLGRMISIGHGGQILLTEATRNQTDGHLPTGVDLRDLGSRRLRGFKDAAHLYQLGAGDLPFQFPALKTVDMRPSNLPAPLTQFIGRDWDVRQVTALLRQPEVRLLTLTGVGGVGKTRLALQVATGLVDEYQDGVHFVPLAALHDTALVARAIARAMGLEEDDRAGLVERLGAHLRKRQTLVVTDNFEQVLDAAPVLTELLALAPDLKILATSREALRVYGEQLYPVAPLNTPDPHEHPDLSHLARYEATRLFMERARAAFPAWTITDADAPVIAEICACLDGLPLALELAAARVSEFSLRDMAAQLTARLGFLSVGPRDVHARHRTLRGMLDWSYALLTVSEKAMFARLAVFVGGWTRSAAEAVTRWEGDAQAVESAAFDALLDKFLIQPTDGVPDVPRFTMLEIIREYALEYLNASPDAEMVRQLHAAYFAQELEEVEPELTGGTHQKSALWMCEVEQDNFRAVLVWALQNRHVDFALRMVKALWRFWGISSQLSEGRRWIEQALEVSDAATADRRAPALYGLGKLAMFQGDYRTAQRAAEQALALFRELSDEDGMGWALNALGEIASNQNEGTRAETYFQSSLELHTKIENKLGIAKALDDLGRLAMERSEYPRAAQLLQESLKLRRARGSVEGIAVGNLALGEVLHLQGDYAHAEKYTRESLARYRQLNHTAGVITCLHNLAQMRQEQKDSAQAIALYTEGLGLLRDLEAEESDLVLACLEGLARAYYAASESTKAALVLGTYARIQDAVGRTADAVDPTADDRKKIRRGLGEAAWAKAMTVGQELSIDDLLVVLTRRKGAALF